MSDPLWIMRVRLYLGGQLISVETLEVTSSDELTGVAQRHAGTLAERAQAENKTFMVEVELLNNPDDPDRFIRFGTDPGGMHDPQPF